MSQIAARNTWCLLRWYAAPFILNLPSNSGTDFLINKCKEVSDWAVSIFRVYSLRPCPYKHGYFYKPRFFFLCSLAFSSTHKHILRSLNVELLENSPQISENSALLFACVQETGGFFFFCSLSLFVWHHHLCAMFVYATVSPKANSDK